MVSKIINTIFGGIFGAVVGLTLFMLISNFFGKTWTVEAGGPALVIYSPIFIPIIVGLIGGLASNCGKALLASIISGVLYLIAGVIIIVIGGLLSLGWGGIAIALFVAAALCGGGTVLIICIVK